MMAKRRSAAPGFTLIELLVVMVLIGITVSFAVLSLDTDSEGEQIDREARRISRLLSLASEEAILQARQLAFEIDQQGYAFIGLVNNEWQRIEDDAVLRRRELPENVYVDLLVDGDSISIDGRQVSTNSRVYLFSSGEMTPFTMTLRSADNRFAYQLKGDIQGKVTYVGNLRPAS